MSEKADYTHQPKPVPNDQPANWDLVLEDIRARDEMGARKYGTRLQAFNGRNYATDAYEEALDLVVYLKGLQVEHARMTEQIAQLTRERDEARESLKKETLAEHSMTFGEIPQPARNMIEPHVWDNFNISEQRDWALFQVRQLIEQRNDFVQAATEAAMRCGFDNDHPLRKALDKLPEDPNPSAILAERDAKVRAETIAEVRQMCEVKVREFNEQLRGQAFIDFARKLEGMK